MDKIIIDNIEYTCSDIHKESLKKIYSIVEKEKNLKCIKDMLRKEKFCYEGILELTNCSMINVYTGTSGFDVTGITIVKYIGTNDIFVRNIF